MRHQESVMATDRVAVAQRGVILADAMQRATAPRRRAGAAKGRGPRRLPKAAGALPGPFLSPGSLTRAERLRLVDGIETVLDGVYTHPPLKRARYGTEPFTRDMAAVPSLSDELAPWKASLEAAVRNGELYSQPIPITDAAGCNAIGQRYGGPVMLLSDSTTYSAGDLFSAALVDNGLGPFCEGLAIEDIGVSSAPYAMTRDDLLAGARDLIAHCISTYPTGTKLVELAGWSGSTVRQRRRIPTT